MTGTILIMFKGLRIRARSLLFDMIRKCIFILYFPNVYCLNVWLFPDCSVTSVRVAFTIDDAIFLPWPSNRFNYGALKIRRWLSATPSDFFIPAASEGWCPSRWACERFQGAASRELVSLAMAGRCLHAERCAPVRCQPQMLAVFQLYWGNERTMIPTNMLSKWLICAQLF